MPDPKECMKPHMMIHSLTGLGVGFILLALVPSLVSNVLMLGIVAVVAGVVLEMVVLKKK